MLNYEICDLDFVDSSEMFSQIILTKCFSEIKRIKMCLQYDFYC